MARHGLVKQIIGSAGGGGIFFTDSSPFAKLLDLCVKLRSSRDARSVHGRLIQIGLLMFMENVVIWIMHAKCLIECLREMFLVIIRLLVL
jgi:hypothetical protein